MDTETGQYEHQPSDGLRRDPWQLIRTACCIQRANVAWDSTRFAKMALSQYSWRVCVFT